MSEAADGSLPIARRIAFALHLAMCRRCRRVYDNLHTILGVLPGLDIHAGSEPASQETDDDTR